MTAKRNTIPDTIVPLILGISLLGCSPNPKSMFEQQAEDKSEVPTVAGERVSHLPNKPESPLAAVVIHRQQAIARQPNCEGAQCQYFELNTLSFDPDLPWLSHVMWQSIARTLDPSTPLVAEDETAKQNLSMLLNQIAYGEQVVTTQPLYQRVDTDLVINPVAQNGSGAATGYLMIRLNKHRKGSQHQQLNCIMLDLKKQVQLTIDDMLLPNSSTDQLLEAFIPVKIKWLSNQGVEAKYLEDSPPPKTDQWYLDEKGLHLIYHSGELLAFVPNTAELIVPFSKLDGFIKPEFIIKP